MMSVVVALLLCLALPAGAEEFAPFTREQIIAKRAQLYEERDKLNGTLAEVAAAIDAKNRELADLAVREKALIDAGQRRVK